MSVLRFSDGVSIDTSGKLRALCLKDGWYVVGDGMCCPVRDHEEAQATINEIQQRRKARETSK